jgi:hypothetical protein
MEMRTPCCFSLLLAAFGLVSTALADSTDDALNQFYTENMMGQLTSDMSSGVSKQPSASPGGGKVHNRVKVRKGDDLSSGSSQRTNTASPFTYMPSGAVTREVYARFTTGYFGSHPKAVNVQAAQKEFAGHSAENHFDARFSRYDFSNHNAADSFAGLLIVAWETVNNQNAAVRPAGIRQVRARLNEFMVSKSAGKAYTNAEKQYNSEYCKVLAMFYTDAANWQKSHNNANSSVFEAFQNSIHQRFLKIGIDLKKLQLTDAGFKQI